MHPHRILSRSAYASSSFFDPVRRRGCFFFLICIYIHSYIANSAAATTQFMLNVACRFRRAEQHRRDRDVYQLDREAKLETHSSTSI